MRQIRTFAMMSLAVVAAACAGARLPAPNSTEAHYDARTGTVQVLVSSLQPASGVALIAQDGTRYSSSGVSIISGPHVLYNPPPSIGLGFGGFGFTGCCTGFGSDVGIGLPVGRPTPAEISDQYVASALIRAPVDYPYNWSSYRLEVEVGNYPIMMAAPAPSA